MGNKEKGFTLLEILIALFIFTIISMMLVGALHNIISAHARTEQKAEELRQLQLTLLIMSRDIEQAINRPIIQANGKEEAAFIGTPQYFTLTHAGFASDTGLKHSELERSGFYVADGRLWHRTWAVLDQAPSSQPHARALLALNDATFQYLDKDKKFHDVWPVDGKGNEPLPRAVRIYLTIPQWGKMSALYVISASATKSFTPPPPPPKS